MERGKQEKEAAWIHPNIPLRKREKKKKTEKKHTKNYLIKTEKMRWPS